MGNNNNKQKVSLYQFTNPLLSFIKTSSSYRQLPGNQAHYLNFVLTKKVYESELMKSVYSNDIIEFVGNVFSHMNEQVLSKKFNTGMYLGLFGDIMKEINNENECVNVFGYNVFIKKDVMFCEKNEQKGKSEGKDIEFPFKFGGMPMKRSYVKNSILSVKNKESVVNNDEKIQNEIINHNERNIKKNESVVNEEKHLLNKNKESNIMNMNSEINNNHCSENFDNNNKNDVLDNQNELLVPSLSSNQIKPEISEIKTLSSNNIFNNNKSNHNKKKKKHIKKSKSICQQQHQHNNLPKNNPSKNADLLNLQTSLHPSHTNNPEFEIDLCNIEITNINTNIKSNQTPSSNQNNNIPNCNLPLHKNINNIYGEFNMTLKPNSKLKPKPKFSPTKPIKNTPNKTNNSSPLFVIDLKDLMHDDYETTFSIPKVFPNENNKQHITHNTFMECLDKFLGFDRSYSKKKKCDVEEIKHRKYNKYSYFRKIDKKEEVDEKEKFNTIGGGGFRKGISMENSMIGCNGKEKSFSKMSLFRKEGEKEKERSDKKKELGEMKRKLDYEFGKEFFEERSTKEMKDKEEDVEGKEDKLDKEISNENVDNDNDKDNFNLSDSDEYLSACSSHHSQEDLI